MYVLVWVVMLPLLIVTRNVVHTNTFVLDAKVTPSVPVVTPGAI